MKKIILLILFIVLVLFGCTNKDNKPRTNITFDEMIIDLYKGDTYQLVPKVTGEVNSVTYIVQTKRIASISNSGLITGLDKGTTYVYAVINNDMNKKITLCVNVIEYSFKINDINIKPNEEIEIDIELNHLELSDLTFEIEDTSIVSINNYKIKGLKVGSTKVIVKAKNISKDIVVTVNENARKDFTLNIYTMNDFHGSVTTDTTGIITVGQYLILEKSKNPDTTLILSAGDMFQGSAISNMSKGDVVVDIMNEIGFDAMTVGNHEFDWQVDNITRVKEKAKFPIICANIYEKSTNKPVTWVEPYTIIEKNGVKIGIIGLIGEELVNDISPSIIAPYEFKDELPIIKEYTKKLRTEEECTVVIVNSHSNTYDLNQNIADLSGDYEVDAIINGHTHTLYSGETRGQDGKLLPYVQAGANGQYIGVITLNINGLTNTVTDGGAGSVDASTLTSSSSSEEILQIIKKYEKDLDSIIKEVISTAGSSISRQAATIWCSDMLKTKCNTEIGLVNTGGIRSNAFPIVSEQDITVDLLWKMIPFDNTVKICKMTTQQILDTVNKANELQSGLQFSTDTYVSNNSLYVNGKLANSTDEFTIATIDYLFDNTNYAFLNSKDIIATGELFRDYAIDALRELKNKGQEWNG